MAIVELEHVSKHFGPTRALADVSLALEPGEIHVLAGENGAGKSTLIRILAGVYRDYQGSLRIDGHKRRLLSPADARRAGIATIHQELSLIGPMSVEDNLRLPDEGPMLGWTRRRDVRALLAPLDVDVDPETPVERLSLSVRQRIEIARALAQPATRRARVLVMDEPTSALAEPEADKLFEQLKALRAQGHAVLFITHRMEEIYRIADRISVLRDGRLVVSAPAGELGPEALVEAMIGRALRRSADARRGGRGEMVLEARDVWVAGAARPTLDRVSFVLHRGEVLGIAGLQGSGAATLPHALFGAVPASLSLWLDGAPLARPTPARCVRRGMLLVSGDRQKSAVPDVSVADNAALSSLAWGWVQKHRLHARVAPLAQRLGVRYASLDAPLRTLSGGNQQKVALARALLCEPRVLLLDEPTRGVDIGAKHDVHAEVRELARRGVAVLLVSSETDELLALCDRILVLARGRLVKTLERGQLSREAVVSAAMGEIA